MRQQVYSYCNEQLQAGEEIELESLSKELSGVSEVSFSEFTADKGYELEESFPADRSTLRQLTKFAGSGGGLTINFDAMLLGERIFWDPATDTLTIKGTPPNLRDQLQRRTSGGKQNRLLDGAETPYPASVLHLYRQKNPIKKPRQGGVFLQLVGDYARTKSM